jgi:hypothetical protein
MQPNSTNQPANTKQPGVLKSALQGEPSSNPKLADDRKVKLLDTISGEMPPLRQAVSPQAISNQDKKNSIHTLEYISKKNQ